MTSTPPFPDRFLWGAATSAYQIEGSPLADGAGPSNWHRFSHTPGLVYENENGDVACDHYRLWRSDVALMKELGLTAYRFSISWSRVLPEGTGRVNQAGLDFYRRLVEALREAGIRPFATLYHWDLPAALDDRGGWCNRDAADWFADYARVAYRALDDAVETWATLNEPWVVSDGGYLAGVLAPGHQSRFEAPLVSHNLLRAHGAAVAAYRAAGGRKAIGIVVNIEPKYPASASAEDAAATRRSDAYMNRQFLDPIFLGRYPEELAEIYGEAWPRFPDSDFEAIRAPIDFLGINYYTRGVMRHDEKEWHLHASRVPQRKSVRTETAWEVYPQGLADTLRWVSERYGRLPALRDRERRGVLRPALRRGRRHARRSPSGRLPPRASARRAKGHRRRRRPAGVFRLVAPRQLRMEPRLLETVRDRSRRFRDPEEDPQGERAVLLRGDSQRGGRARRRARGSAEPLASNV